MPRREEEYAREYKMTGNRALRDKAVHEMRDLIFSQVRSMNLSQGLDTRTLYMKGLGLASHAVDSWDPGKSKLSTHVVNSLKPLHRDVYKHGPVLHVPEHNIKDFGEFMKVHDSYVNEYGDRDPDPVVLSDRSGLSRRKVEEFLKRIRKVYHDSTQSFRPVEYVRSDHRLDTEYLAAQFEKDPLQKKVWKHISIHLGKQNAHPPNARDIHRKIGGSYYEVNKAYNEIIEILNDYLA